MRSACAVRRLALDQGSPQCSVSRFGNARNVNTWCPRARARFLEELGAPRLLEEGPTETPTTCAGPRVSPELQSRRKRAAESVRDSSRRSRVSEENPCTTCLTWMPKRVGCPNEDRMASQSNTGS